MLYWDDMQGFRSFFSRKVWFWGLFSYITYMNGIRNERKYAFSNV